MCRNVNIYNMIHSNEKAKNHWKNHPLNHMVGIHNKKIVFFVGKPSKLSLRKHCRIFYVIEVSRPAMMLHSMMTTMEVFVNYCYSIYEAACWIFPISHYLHLDSVFGEKENVHHN